MHLVAVLQGEPGQEAAILRAARGRLGALKAPKAVIWRQDWPVLPSGKTDLRGIGARGGAVRAYVIAARRTRWCRAAGRLRGWRLADLAAPVVAACLADAGIAVGGGG